jgi:TRAP-type C4-dicarboxylate transport system permease small subunit
MNNRAAYGFSGVIELLIGWMIKVNKGFITIGFITLFLMMIIDTVNIVGIKFGFVVIPGGKTIIEELMTIVVFIGLGFVMFERGHMKTEILKSLFPPFFKKISSIIGYLLMVLVSTFLFWAHAKVAIQYFREGVTSPSDIAIPMGPSFTLIALAFLNVAVCAALLGARELSGGQPQKR